MPDTLRTRIAAVLYNNAAESVPNGVPWLRWEDSLPVVRDVWLAMADAVIRELNLQPETLCTSGGAILSRLDGKVLADNRRMTRWATPWECDESPVK